MVALFYALEFVLIGINSSLVRRTTQYLLSPSELGSGNFSTHFVIKILLYYYAILCEKYPVRIESL
jgi:hypothetical protein